MSEEWPRGHTLCVVGFYIPWWEVRVGSKLWASSSAKRKDAKPIDMTSEKKSRGLGSSPMEYYSCLRVQGRKRRATRNLQRRLTKDDK